MALYLKYRPQSLDQLIGQEQIKKTLLSASQADKLSHAYLFVGPRGTGKTSTARILAKMVNCQLSVVSLLETEKQKTDNQTIPCNQCSSCISITDGSSLDLIEIDAASNRGIDDIRTLRENIKLSPAFSKKKIYIIDEVHMLTTEAFNALLKTLEEPPKHALFILATTDVQKVPQTILSRVQRLDFKLAAQDDLHQALKKIIDSEKIEISEEALQVILKRAEGSFRDGVKLLDQVSSSGKSVTLADVSLILQTVEFGTVINFLEILSKKDAQSSLIFISENIIKGSDAKGWVVSLMDVFRSLMLIKTGVGKELVSPEYDEEKYLKLTQLAEKFAVADLVKALDLLQQALEKMKFTSIPVLPLELAVVEMCLELRVKNQESSKAQIGDISVSQDATLNPRSEVTPSPAIIASKERRFEEAGLLGRKQSSQELDPTQIASAMPRNDVIGLSDDAVNKDIAILQEKWNFVLETIKPYNFSLEALLRLVKILECSSGRVVLEVPYSFHQRILEAPKSRDLLESVLSDVLAKPTRVSCVIAQKPMTVDDIANVEVAADDEIIKAAAEIFSSDSSN